MRAHTLLETYRSSIILRLVSVGYSVEDGASYSEAAKEVNRFLLLSPIERCIITLHQISAMRSLVVWAVPRMP